MMSGMARTTRVAKAQALLAAGHVGRERSGGGQARTWVIAGEAFSDDTIRTLYAHGVATDQVRDGQRVVCPRG